MARDYLEKCIQDKQVATSYLFTGKKGLGKEALAIDFIKMLFEDGHHKVDEGNHPDVKLVGDERDEASIKIETVREIQSWLKFKPFEANYKVVVILDAERMTLQAQNAFLKTLEEPPEHSIVILTSQSPLQLIPTILSRVQEVRLLPLSQEKLQEQLGRQDDATQFVTYHADGSLEEAKALIESGISERREELFGLFFNKNLNEFFNYFDKETKAKGGEFIKESLVLLNSLLRDILLSQSQDSIDSNLFIHKDHESEIKQYAATHSREQILQAVGRLQELSGYMDSNVNPKLATSSLGVVLNQ